jgi:hypothetical protein
MEPKDQIVKGGERGMRRSVSALLILSLLVTIVVPVWASQPAPQARTVSLGVGHDVDDGWRDVARKVVKQIGIGCAVWSGAVVASGGSLCINGVGAWICGGCALFTIAVAVGSAVTD